MITIKVEGHMRSKTVAFDRTIPQSWSPFSSRKKLTSIMFFSRAFLLISFGVSVIAAPVHTHSSDKISPTDYGFWHKENGKDVLRIDGNHGGLTLELYKLEALTKGGNPKPEHVFITHGDKDHPILDPKENAALVVGDQWVRLSWKYVPAQYQVGGETGYDAHLNIKMGGDRALRMTIDTSWED